jgi:hypothetical protein
MINPHCSSAISVQHIDGAFHNIDPAQSLRTPVTDMWTCRPKEIKEDFGRLVLIFTDLR